MAADCRSIYDGFTMRLQQLRKRAFKTRGITADAAALGCSRFHLAAALRGERTASKDLLIRYHRLQISKLESHP